MNLRMLAPPLRLALIIDAWLVLHWISKNCEFAGVRSAVEVGFDYRGLVCIIGSSKSSEFADAGSALEVGFA